MTTWFSQMLPVVAAQSTERWAKTLEGTGDDYGYSVQQTTDGGYIVTGFTRSFGAGLQDLLLSKLSVNGTLTWAKTLGGTGDDIGYSVWQTTDGGYIVTGITTSFGAGGDDLWLTKWGADGSLNWAKTLGGSGNDAGSSVQQTADGGYIVTGSTYSFGAGSYDLWLTKWDSQGNLIWVKTLGGWRDDRGDSIQQTTDGGYIVTGSTVSFGVDDRNLWLTKWDSQGNLTWVKTLDGGSYDYGYSVQQTVDGGYIVTGYTTSFGAGSDLWLIKWDSQGNLIWVKTLDGGSYDYGNSVQQTTDGGYIVTGSTQSFGAGSYDLWLTKWDSQGNLIWSKTFGGGGYDTGYSVQQTTDGGYIVTGTTDGFGEDGYDLWLTKWDSQGSIGGNTCVSEPNVSSISQSLNAASFTLTPGTPAVTSQTLAISAHGINLTSITICKDAPMLANSGGTFIYTENELATVMDSSITISDVDSPTLASANISISSGFAGSEDVLDFIDQNGIMGNYNNAIGILSLRGTSTVFNYQVALRNVTYQNSSNNPTAGLRTFSFTVNDGELSSNTVTRNATIIPVNDAPLLFFNQLTITQGDAVILANNDLEATDVDTSPEHLQFTISDIAHGQFEHTVVSGAPITTFTQQEINEGGIRFVHDGSNQAPAYQVSVSDGIYATSPVSANVNFTPKSTNKALIAGVAAGASTLTLGVLGVSFWYVKRRQRLAKAQQQARETEMGIEMVEGIRQEKGHTVIYGKQGNYALLNKIKTKEAQALLEQTGIEVTFPDGKHKAKFELGRGQFGKLRLAKITALKKSADKNTSMKVGNFMGVKKIKGEKEIRLSKQEADMQLKLSGQAHIMPLLESIETKDSEGQSVLYQFMPLAGFGNGETLQQYLAQVKDEMKKLRILVHVAKGVLTGMANMHDNHIYHLDMKPSNLVLSKEGDIYLIDFGCAQEMRDGQLTGGNGDMRYYAPERLEQCRQVQAGKYYSVHAAKVDAWAGGLTLFELATNQYPFDKNASAADRIISWDNTYFVNKLAKIAVLANAEPKSYWAVVKGLLALNPAERLSIEDALNFINGLRQYIFSSVTAQQATFAELKQLEKEGLALPQAHHQHYEKGDKTNKYRNAAEQPPFSQHPSKNATYEQTPAPDSNTQTREGKDEQNPKLYEQIPARNTYQQDKDERGDERAPLCQPSCRL